MMTEDIGQHKSIVAGKFLVDFSEYYEYTALEKFEKNSNVTPYVFTGFDNIASRELMFNQWLKLKDRELFVDGRLLAESFEIFVVTKEKGEDRYRKYLFPDDEVPDLACTAKATTHCGAMVASMMVGVMNNYLTNKECEEDIRDVPFHMIFDMSLFNLEIKY